MTINRRAALKFATAGTLTALLPNTSNTADRGQTSRPTHNDTFGLLKKGRKIPVIFDTDIGGDIDDTWALLYLLKCPELDVRLVATDAGMGLYRTRLAAKFLTACGRDDVPVSISHGARGGLGHQQGWLGDYQLENYRGPVHEDSVDAIIKTIHDSQDPITLICIGAVPNIAEALRRDPTIVNNARFVGMHGAIKVGYGGQPPVVPEANVRGNPQALRTVFAADWECSVTPLDTCGIVELQGPRYARIVGTRSPGISALMENYRDWLTRVPWLEETPDPSRKSSTLFDLVAVYMAFSEEFLNMENLNISVEDDGLTRIVPESPPVRCAMSWKNLDGFKDSLVNRLVKD
jgi:inosine-uridine nucleoside N-ribohydrolase